MTYPIVELMVVTMLQKYDHMSTSRTRDTRIIRNQDKSMSPNQAYRGKTYEVVSLDTASLVVPHSFVTMVDIQVLREEAPTVFSNLKLLLK